MAMQDWIHKYPRVQALMQGDEDILDYEPDIGEREGFAGFLTSVRFPDYAQGFQALVSAFERAALNAEEFRRIWESVRYHRVWW